MSAYSRGDRALTWGLAALLSAVLITACGSGSPGQGGLVAAMGVSRAAPNADQRERVATATTGFAVDLLHRLPPTGNQVFSPYSIVTALEMARVGAAGRTAAQMDRVLHAGHRGVDLNAGLNALDQQLTAAPAALSAAQRADLPRLSVANSLWGQRGTAFEPQFLNVLARDYASGMHVVDYQHDSQSARGQINSWVADRTRRRITNLLPVGTITRQTRLVLVNALYLKAKWQEQFDRSSTKPGAFFVSPGRQVQARFMTRAPFQARYLASSGYQAVELPYRQSELSMLIIAPASGQLANFERSLTPSVLNTIVTNLMDTQIDLHLPRFHFTTKTDLAQTLTAMGMRDAFTDAADFSAITRPQRLRISHVEHQAYLSADEQGTEATAATSVTAIATAAPSAPAVSLTINRPFVFAVRDGRSGLILFLGRVDDPSAG